jgi:hypothetical protein
MNTGGEAIAVAPQFHGERHGAPLVAIAAAGHDLGSGSGRVVHFEVLSAEGFKMRCFLSGRALVEAIDKMAGALPDIFLISMHLPVRHPVVTAVHSP